MTAAELSTDRLLLRQWREEDLEPFAELNADPRVMEFFPAPLTREQSDALALRHRDLLEAGEPGVLAAEDEHGFIGFIGLAVPRFDADFTPCVEIGWRLAVRAWGQGYAIEGARAVAAYAFDQLGLDELVSFTAILNTRSEAVMRRLGMRRDRTFLHPRLDADDRLAPHVLYRVRPGEVSP